MNYQIVIQPNAQTDIERAYRWLLERAPTRAVTWYNGVQQAINQVGQVWVVPVLCRCIDR